jgi:hypothetical protein
VFSLSARLPGHPGASGGCSQTQRVLSLGDRKNFILSSRECSEQLTMKLSGWIQGKQNERRCRAQGFRPKLCQAMRWKEENDRIGQLLDSEFSST